MITEAMALMVFPALMAFAACSDLFTMTISNRVALALMAGFLAMALVLGMSWHQVGMHLAAGTAVLLIGFVCFARGWIGGGDAKLAAATALWLGFDHMFAYLIWASLLGGALTLLIIKYRTMPLPRVLAGQEWAVRLHSVDAGVPYGIALAMAALLIYPDTAFMKAAGI